MISHVSRMLGRRNSTVLILAIIVLINETGKMHSVDPVQRTPHIVKSGCRQDLLGLWVEKTNIEDLNLV